MNIYLNNQIHSLAFSGMKESKEKIASITYERLDTLVKSGKKVKEICAILGIPERTYSRLLDKFGIITPRKEAKNRINSITAEELQKLVDDGLSIDEIVRKLQIDKAMFYKLLKRLHINYDYQHHVGEIRIPPEVLRQMTKSGKNTAQIAAELGISQGTFHQKAKCANVKTILRDSIDTISSVSKEEVQSLIDKGLKQDEICKKLNITRVNFIALMRKYNLQTPQKRSMDIISRISKQQLLDLRAQGKMIKEICKLLSISLSTYRRIINR